MRHTLWHSGVLIGEARLRRSPANARQIFGELRLTAYGRELLPRLSVLPAAAALTEELAARRAADPTLAGVPDVDLVESLPAGQRMVDIGRALSEVELRDPSGAVLEFETIAFLDLAELSALSRKNRPSTPAGTFTPAPSRVMVSATLARRRAQRADPAIVS